MFNHIRHSTTVKFLWAFMGLYFLNISVDTVDANPNYITEDLSFNDQENNLLIGIVTGIPVARENERFSTFLRLIWKPAHK